MAFNFRSRHKRCDTGRVWPGSGTGTLGANLDDAIGPRPFASHIPTTGFDYDYHRGVDDHRSAGSSVFSPIHGHVIRRHYTHFDWADSAQTARWMEIDAGAFATFTHTAGVGLRVTGSNAGLQTILASAHFRMLEQAPLTGTSAEADLQCTITSSLASSNVRIGIGWHDPVTNEFFAVHHDIDAGAGNSRFAFEKTDSVGNVTGTGTVARGATNWLRARHSDTANLVFFEHSTDGSTWAALNGAGTAFVPTASFSRWVPFVFWRPSATGMDGTADLSFVGCVHDDTIGRFGNWLMIANTTDTWVLNHARHLSVALGDVVQAGQLIGLVGNSGFDARSGRVLTNHIHFEYIPSTVATGTVYANANPRNALQPGIMPRANTSSNVSVVRTEENDPNGNASHALDITVTRNDQDLDLGAITFTGNVDTRTVNLSTQAGLNADPDIPDNNDVYITGFAFDTTSVSYRTKVFFRKAGGAGGVGATFASYSVSDSAGTVVASG